MADTGRRVRCAVALLGLVVGLVLPASGQAPAARRLALVIGNAAYAEPAARLSYPVNDALAMTAMLEELGFTVTVETDADILAMERAADRFIGQVRSGDVALFYYSGHGIEVGGENYLAPVDFLSDYDVTKARRRSLAALEVQERMAEAGARVRLVILDACRDNPFERTKTLTRGGLTAMQGRGGLVAFAAEAGARALEPPGERNGLYTKHLLEALEEPDVPIRELLTRVRTAVHEASNERQTPATYDALVGDFVFRRGIVPGRRLAFGTPASATLSGSGSDRWTFTGRADEQVTVELTSEAFDTYLELRGPAGELVMENDDGGDDLNSLIENQTLDESGDYTVVARAYDDDDRGGQYSLLLRRGVSDRRRLVVGTPASATLSGSGSDRWTFTGRADEQVTVELTSEAFDTYLELRGPAGELVMANDDGGDGRNSLIENQTLDESGDYTVVARSYSDSQGGPYTLSVRRGSIDPPSRDVAQLDVAQLRQIAGQGDAPAQIELGAMYATGRGVAQDDGEAVTWFRRAAEQGNSIGQTSLGAMYRAGRGVAQDDGEAVTWYRRAADQGNSIGQTNLGVMYQTGRGVAQDDGEAVTWYRRAADQGYSIGQYNLGAMYFTGRGVAQDDGEAVTWFRRAAEQGNASGQNNLGGMYRTGRGVTQDDGEAVTWYRRAAEQRDAGAQRNLGFMYQTGRGVAQDDGEAVTWYRRAADQGDDYAQNQLGVMYENGSGVRQDRQEAVRWFRLAADQGHAGAQRNLDRLQ